MKILYHHRTSARDGSAVHINGLVTALRALGAEVLVVAPPLAGAQGAGSSASGAVSSLRKSLPRAVHELGELAYNASETRRLHRAVREFEPDILYQRSNLFLLSGASVCRARKLPLIEEVNAPYFIERSRHGGIALPRIADWAERKAWNAADAVIAVTQVLADIVADQGVPRERLHVMPNGIDTELLRPEARVSTAKADLGLTAYTVIGFTGYVRDWNGLDEVIDLMARPAAASWFLFVVGDGPARAALEERARQLGVAGRMRFTGVVGRSEVPKFVSAFDVALQPAANPYASPLKLFEYLALARPIVAPNQPNIAEILRDGENALLFEPGSVDALGAAIQRLASDAALRARLSAAATATVLERDLTWRHNAARVLQLAEGLVGGAGSRRTARSLAVS